MVELISTQAQ